MYPWKEIYDWHIFEWAISSEIFSFMKGLITGCFSPFSFCERNDKIGNHENTSSRGIKVQDVAKNSNLLGFQVFHSHTGNSFPTQQEQFHWYQQDRFQRLVSTLWGLWDIWLPQFWLGKKQNKFSINLQKAFESKHLLLPVNCTLDPTLNPEHLLVCLMGPSPTQFE